MLITNTATLLWQPFIADWRCRGEKVTHSLREIASWQLDCISVPKASSHSVTNKSRHMTNQSNPRKVTTEAKNPIKLSKKLQVSAQQESARGKKTTQAWNLYSWGTWQTSQWKCKWSVTRALRDGSRQADTAELNPQPTAKRYDQLDCADWQQMPWWTKKCCCMGRRARQRWVKNYNTMVTQWLTSVHIMQAPNVAQLNTANNAVHTHTQRTV